MEASILLVGDEYCLKRSRAQLLAGSAKVTIAGSRDAETAIASQPYNLIVLCQTVPEYRVRRVLNLASKIEPRPAIMVINGSERHRKLGAATHDVELANPAWFRTAVVQLVHSL
jgi:hypothetical protein